MTLNEYLQNPYGKGASFANAPAQRASFESQFETLGGKITSRIYLYRNNVIYHVLIPSQKNDGQTYDVIIEIKLPNGKEKLLDVNDLDFRAFSNCPSFVYTYAYAFFRKDMLCTWLENKYSVNIRKSPSTNTNAYNVIGFERSIYLALRHIKAAGRTTLQHINLAANKPNSYTEIARTIRSQDDIMRNIRSKMAPNEPPKTVPAPKAIGSVPRKDRARGDFLTRTRTTDTTEMTEITGKANPRTARTGRTSRVNRTRKI